MVTRFERRHSILRLLREHPGIKVTQIAEMLDVSDGTIRNDFNALQAEHKIKRVLGGAVIVQQQPPTYAESDGRGSVNVEVPHVVAKQRIARWAADTIEDGETLFLDASSTVRFMVPHLSEYSRLTIVTNGLDTAKQIARNTPHPVILVGGIVSRSGAATTSLIGLDMLENLHIRTAYVSCVGLELAIGMTERSIEEAQLKKVLLLSIPRVIALVGSNKIGKVSTQPFVTPERITHLFTDSDVSAESIAQVRQARINLTVCGENTVRSFTVDGDQPQVTIGFANQSEELPFAIDVRRSLERAAVDAGSINLVTADNQLSGEEALRVADRLVQRDIDLAIEYQIDYKAGSLIMDKFQQADIPVIAVDIPMVGATFFGVDNYRAGHMAGEALGEWIHHNWNGHIDLLLVLEEPRAGLLPEARIQGQLDGLQEKIRVIPPNLVHTIDCGNTSAISETGVAAMLQQFPNYHHVAIVSFNDEAAYGALQAARRSSRETDVVIVGQGADRLVHEELRNPQSRLIGSTAYMPERYGDKLMELALKILNGESVPPAVYISHVFISSENIDRFYPVAD
ncbi:MAG: substrate-binding domain-containing protein [Candidatus Promineifilaceae bacterium]